MSRQRSLASLDARIQALPDNTSEANLQAAAIDLATMTGWLCSHQRPAMVRSGKFVTAVSGHVGFPDLALVHPGRGLACFVELKSRLGRLTVEQQAWGAGMRAAGLEHRVIRPSDWVPFAHYLIGNL